MVQSMVSVVVISVMVWVKYSPYGYLGPFGTYSPMTAVSTVSSVSYIKGTGTHRSSTRIQKSRGGDLQVTGGGEYEGLQRS